MKYFITITIFSLLLFFSSQARAAELEPKDRLQLAKARLLITKGKNEKEALSIINQLKEKYPKDAQILFMDAILKQEINLKRQAFETIKQAKTLAPEDKYIQQFYDILYKENQSFISLGHSFEFREDDTDLQITQLKIEDEIYPFFRLGVDLEYGVLDADLLQLANGTNQKVSVNNRRGEAYLKHDHKNGDFSKYSLFAANEVGAALQYHDWHLRGHNKIALEYNKPNWDFLIGLAEELTRDKIEIGRSQKINSNLSFNISGGANRYNINNDNNVLSTTIFKLDVFYNLIKANNLLKALGKDSYIFLGYNIDGEYKSSITSKINSNNVSYRPLPFSSREIHTASVTVGRHFNPEFLLESTIGLSKNRFGDFAPSFHGKMIYEFLPDLELMIQASHLISTDNVSQKTNRIEAVIKKRF